MWGGINFTLPFDGYAPKAPQLVFYSTMVVPGDGGGFGWSWRLKDFFQRRNRDF
jgi:hypothetical protein